MLPIDRKSEQQQEQHRARLFFGTFQCAPAFGDDTIAKWDFIKRLSV